MSPGPVERLKPYFKPRARGRRAAGAKVQPAPGSQPAPPALESADGGGLRTRREQLAHRFAELQSDLGGLAYEMAIRDSFRHDVLVRRAAELQAVDRELTAAEQQLGIGAATASCPSCRAPVQPGAAYCARCGSAIGSPAPSGGSR